MIGALRTLIDTVFAFEDINGNGATDKYLHRWRLLSLFGRKVCLHHFIGDDWSRALHDHPKRFWSIGLWGSYIEESWAPRTGRQVRTYRAPWLRTFPASHAHRLRLTAPDRTCWTLVIVGRPEQEWGFYSERGWEPWHRYVFRKTGTAE